MQRILKMFLSGMMILLLLTPASGQQSKDKKPKAKAKMEEPPPPRTAIHDTVIIDTAASQPALPAEQYPAMPVSPVPQVDFDTSAVPADSFTINILRLMEVTNAMNIGLQFANNLSNGIDDSNELMREFYARFMKEMREGTARRWLERIYVRHYRQHYTNEEIKTLIRFYDSPIGKKLIDQTTDMLPSIMQESRKMGEYLGMQMMMELLKEKQH